MYKVELFAIYIIIKDVIEINNDEYEIKNISNTL